MLKTDNCGVCGIIAPPTDTNHTLISLGWRVTRAVAASGGGHVFKWHCPSCWAGSKEGREEAPASRTVERG